MNSDSAYPPGHFLFSHHETTTSDPQQTAPDDLSAYAFHRSAEGRAFDLDRRAADLFIRPVDGQTVDRLAPSLR